MLTLHTSKIPGVRIDPNIVCSKEELLSEYAEFHWSEGSLYLFALMGKKQFFKWNAPRYMGDNIVSEITENELNRLLSDEETFWQNQGYHPVSKYCNNEIETVWL